MRRIIRLFLLIEGVSFLLAGQVHMGLLVAGYAHQEAALAESTIAVVLLLGFGATWVWSTKTRLIGIGAQAFALLGTLVGLFTIAIGVGPRTVPDLAFHLVIVIALVGGLAGAGRLRADVPTEVPLTSPWVLNILFGATSLVLLLVFAQAVLGGEWLVGYSALIEVHNVNGQAILVLALLQVVLVAIAGLTGRQPPVMLGATGLFLLLALVQETLGFGGREAANQARAMHIANGVLVFGVGLANVWLARDLRSSVLQAAAHHQRGRNNKTVRPLARGPEGATPHG